MTQLAQLQSQSSKQIVAFREQIEDVKNKYVGEITKLVENSTKDKQETEAKVKNILQRYKN